MLSLRRFTALAESYGADLGRWPAGTSEAAQALLEISPEARRILSRSRLLDEAIDAARRHESAALWQRGELDAAMSRLRAGVARRIERPATQSELARGRPEFVDIFWARLGLLGFAASGGCAVTVGLLIGALSVAEPAPANLLAVFQATPIHIFTG